MIKKTTLLSLLAMTASAQVGSTVDGFEDAADGFGDAADGALDDAEDRGAAIADGALEDAEAVAADAEDDAKAASKDGVKAAKGAAKSDANAAKTYGSDWRYWPDADLWIGIIDCIDVAWWLIWGWFVYIKTNTSDDNVKEYDYGSGAEYDALPIAWFWYNLSHPTKGYTALTYLFIWLFYLIIAVPGMIFWIWQMVEDDADRCTGASGTWLFMIWSKWPGLYGSWVLYFLTVLMPILQMAQINGDIFAPGWINAIVQVAMMTLTWLATGIIHILFTPALEQSYTDRCDNTPAAAPKKAKVVEKAVEEVEPDVDDGNDWD